jgi:hypothetical protein
VANRAGVIAALRRPAADAAERMSARAVAYVAGSEELPLRDRNALLLAAGFAPAYAETGLDEPGLAPVRDAPRTVLDGHRPYPAIVVDRDGDLMAANAPFGFLTEGVSAELLAPPANVYRIALHPAGLAPRIVNLHEWARHVLERLDQALERGPDERLAALRAELGSYVPPAPSARTI